MPNDENVLDFSGYEPETTWTYNEETGELEEGFDFSDYDPESTWMYDEATGEWSEGFDFSDYDPESTWMYDEATGEWSEGFDFSDYEGEDLDLSEFENDLEGEFDGGDSLEEGGSTIPIQETSPVVPGGI